MAELKNRNQLEGVSMNRRSFLALPFVAWFASKFKKTELKPVIKLKMGTVVPISRDMIYTVGPGIKPNTISYGTYRRWNGLGRPGDLNDPNNWYDCKY